jgi:hypothetical protein
MVLQPFVGPRPFFIFSIYTHSIGLIERGIDPSQGHNEHKDNTSENKHTQTSISVTEFEPTTPVFDQAKAVHALDRAATVIGT